MRVSRLRESKLQSVGWSWLPGAFPPACSSLCNTHCNSAHRHLPGAREGQAVQTGSQGMNPAPHHSCPVFHFCFSSPSSGIPQTSLHLFSSASGTASPAEQWVLSASLCVHRSERGYFPQVVPPFCLLPREKRGKMQRKDFFFKWRWSKGYWNKPKQEPEIANMDEKSPEQSGVLETAGIEIPWGNNPWIVRSKEKQKCFIKAFSPLGRKKSFSLTSNEICNI